MTSSAWQVTTPPGLWRAERAPCLWSARFRSPEHIEVCRGLSRACLSRATCHWPLMVTPKAWAGLSYCTVPYGSTVRGAELSESCFFVFHESRISPTAEYRRRVHTTVATAHCILILYSTVYLLLGRNARALSVRQPEKRRERSTRRATHVVLSS